MPSTHTRKPRSAKPVPVHVAEPLGEPDATPEAAPASAIGDAEKREVLIRLAAYTFYERRGCVTGHELEDWLQAEMEVDRQLASSAPPLGTP